MTAEVEWLYPPDEAKHYDMREPMIAIRGVGDDWSVVRLYQTALPTPSGAISVPAEIVACTGLSFAEARRRAAAMLNYIRGPCHVAPPTWPDRIDPGEAQRHAPAPQIGGTK